MQAYRSAWDRCLNRIQHILRALQAPVVKEVITAVVNAHSDVLPGLPYPEVPAIALHGANSSFVQDIVSGLERVDNSGGNCSAAAEASSGPQALQVHLYPSECSSVANMTKGIVTGFTDGASSMKRRTTTSLASFDIALLRAWYASQASEPKLVIFLHEFEMFDIGVVQDPRTHIRASLHVPQLPLVFVLLMASPAVPSYLRSAYPRSTLALLRVHTIVASGESAAVKDVLTKLTYMKHFTQPLSIFTHDEQLGKASISSAEARLTSPEFHPLVEALQVRLLAASFSATQSRAGSSTPTSPRKPRGTAPPHEWHGSTAAELLQCVSRARSAFREQTRRFRIAFAVACIAERLSLSISSTNGGRATGSERRLESIETLSAVLRGRASDRIRYVCMAVRKLSLQRLRALLQQLHALLWELKSAEVRRDEEAARVFIVATLNQLPPDPGSSTDDDEISRGPAVKQLAATLGDWLQAYIEERFVRLDEQLLWDIWYTGNTPFPSELVNPAPRPMVVSALLHPDTFVRAHAELVGSLSGTSSAESGEREPSLWQLPDISIAFRRYVEAGRMVNVYDWFESFAVVLETQRRKLRQKAQDTAGDLVSPGVSSRGRGKANGRTKKGAGRRDMDMDVDEGGGEDDDSGHDDGDEDMAEDELDAEEEERWKVEVQARFIRALHELDYMGFVKHTGRKPDHVIRTVYDVPD
ncbi:hypothetical protein BV20DRAFT_1039250 [Pilatotrama ljubarskyi]|nr:hypothetical protein BV20DRAFT_1039250 [Pilatotrama ljubarskyi]